MHEPLVPTPNKLLLRRGPQPLPSSLMPEAPLRPGQRQSREIGKRHVGGEGIIQHETEDIIEMSQIRTYRNPHIANRRQHGEEVGDVRVDAITPGAGEGGVLHDEAAEEPVDVEGVFEPEGAGVEGAAEKGWVPGVELCLDAR